MDHRLPGLPTGRGGTGSRASGRRDRLRSVGLARVVGGLATLLPPDGDAFLRVQRIGSGKATCAHLDRACSSVDAERHRHEELGAGVVRTTPDWTTLVDPAGLPYCLTRRDPLTGTL